MRKVEYTNQFKRDYKREKSGKSRQFFQKLDDALMAVVALLAADATLPPATATMPSAANGMTAAIVTSNPTWFSSIASRTPIVWSWCVSDRTVNWGCDAPTPAPASPPR